jgi:parallel beta-helix repeat protein
MHDLSAVFYWLVDLYAVSTFLLITATLALLIVKQPIRRQAIAWATFVGLGLLLATSILPNWPRSAFANAPGSPTSPTLTSARTEPLPSRERDLGPALNPSPPLTARAEGRTSAPKPVTRGVADQFRPVTSGDLEAQGLSSSIGQSIRERVAYGFICLAAATAAWLAFGAFLTMRMMRRGTKPSAEAVRALEEVAGKGARLPRLRVSPHLAQPAAAGILKPMILLPSRLTTVADKAEMKVALAHEWNHIRRGDLWLLALSRLLEVLFFAHPLFWWLKHRVYLDQEYLADHAAAQTINPISYAELLLRWSREKSRMPWFSCLTSSFAQRLRLKQRMTMLLNSPRQMERGFNPRWVCLTSGATVGLALVLSFGTVCPQRTVAGADWTPPGVLTVDAAGNGTHRSIQDAIDAAPPGALIRIAAGRYDERLSIQKPLILEGAGWEATTIALTDRGNPWDFGALRESFKRRAELAKSDREREELMSEFQERAAKMSHAVVGANGAQFRGLKLTMPAGVPEGGGLSVPVLKIVDSKVSLSECAVLGAPGHGIVAEEEADVEINDCLVAAVWGTGIRVEGRATVRVSNSDIRNCRYAGIRVGRDGGPTTVEQCRVSDAAWHGIRYDDVSPTITGNIIFGNARCGIYASGKTAATIKGNLFFRNTMGGVSCWFQNEDVITGNTFVRNGAKGVSCLGKSEPVVQRNLFYADEITTGAIGDPSPYAAEGNGPKSENNLFWDESESGRAKASRSFVNIAARDFSLKTDASAREDRIGAADLIAFDSHWPLQPEELAIIPDGETRDSRAWKRPKRRAAVGAPSPARVATARTSPADDRVAAAGSQPGTVNTLQALIDAANPGSEITVPKGVYRLPVTINKPLTLKGETDSELEVTADRPALSIATEGDVKIEGLTIKYQRRTSERLQDPPCALIIKDTKVTVTGCRVVALGNNARCPAGVIVRGFSDVTLQDCRLTGFEFTVQYWDGAEGTVADCVVVNPGHCGITVGRDSKVTVSGNIVTGSGYHAVRCTGGTIMARNNLIIQNQNRGFYLGNRRARGEVANNLIIDNGTGLSGFGGSDIKIRHNVILRASYAGLGTRDNCPLTVANNIFQENTRGIIIFEETGRQQAVIQKNTFWANDDDSENFTLPEGSLKQDPSYKDANAGDYSPQNADLIESQQGLSDPTVFRGIWRKWLAVKDTVD